MSLSGFVLALTLGAVFGLGVYVGSVLSAPPAPYTSAVTYDAEIRTESKALEAYEASKPLETWIDRLEQEVLGHE